MQFPKWSRKRWTLFTIGLVSMLMVLIYGRGVLYYNQHFLPNTHAAGVSVANQTVESARQLVDDDLANRPLDFLEDESTKGYLNVKDLEVTVDIQKKLLDAMSQQSAWHWPLALLGINKQEVAVNDNEINMDNQLLELLLTKLGVDNQKRVASEDAYLRVQDTQFVIEAEKYGKQISAATLKQAILQAINQGQTQVDLAKAYIQPQVTKESKALKEHFAQVEKMQQTVITLTFDGNEVTIPKASIVSWIYFDDNGQPQVDVDLVQDYIRELNYQYAGLFQQRQFESTYQGTVTIEPGTYGWYIDRFEESEAIIADIQAGAQTKREPVIGGSGYGMGDSVGNSYVEVDIANQTMLIYLDGALALQTPVVTGLPGTNTVPGAYQVWNKESPSVLVGYNPNTNVDYQQPVDYWIAFDDQAQGIHDANWQGTFGGTAYLYSGSLGCVNTPPGIMGQVYELIYYGMPVIIF